LGRFLFKAFPAVNKEWIKWVRVAEFCPDPELKKQALASLQLKKFHCLGGSVFSVWDNNQQEQLVRAIVSLQTISDYLDNLCDRAGIVEEKVFRHLHRAITDALSPETALNNYYQDYPHTQDGGYLNTLVSSCREVLATLPTYSLVYEQVMELAGYYCDLQATKHISPEDREERMKQWLLPVLKEIPENIYWWELAAATGSTLGIFSMMAAASRENTTEASVKELKKIYFPWIGGLHILLDYYIDRQEDAEEGDLNFFSFYPDEREAPRRLLFFLQRSREKAKKTNSPNFHLLVIEGLLAMYLSDKKVRSEKQIDTRKFLLNSAGANAISLFNLCKALRMARIL